MNLGKLMAQAWILPAAAEWSCNIPACLRKLLHTWLEVDLWNSKGETYASRHSSHSDLEEAVVD
jgi:hypothetical protein